jgi:hypothetical protein
MRIGMQRATASTLGALVGLGATSWVGDARAVEGDEVQARNRAAEEIRVEGERERRTAREKTAPGPLVEAFGGYGAVVGSSAQNDLGAGIGGRIGFVFPVGAYVGASFTYHFGSTQSAGNVTSGHAQDLYGGGELGWQLAWPMFSVRPYLGAGAGSLKFNSTYGGVTSGDSELGAAFWGGVLVAFRLAPLYFGLDPRALLRTNDGSNGVALFADAGVTF